MSVKIQTGKEINPQIYAYTTPNNLDNSGWVKIGYTEREVEKRIREQTHTASVKTDILWHHVAEYLEDPKKGQTFKDYDFHQFLRYHEIERRPKTEWFYFNGDPNKAEGLFERFVRHDVSGYQPGQGADYVLRKEQAKAVATTLSYMKTHPKGEFLWNAKPRFGKTLSSYDLVTKLGVENVLIVTNRPAIANSWFDDFQQFIAGKTDYKFVSESDSLKNRPTLSRKDFMTFLFDHEDAKQIAFLSLQDLKGSKYFGGSYDKLQWVAQTPWDLLIIDEAHEGVDTFKTDVAFENIHRNFTLHLSGTPFKALAKGAFSVEQIFNWSYADEQSAKINWPAEEESENPYEALPQLNLFTYQMSRMVTEQLDQGAQVGEDTIDFAFDLNEFFATNDSGNFIHEDAVIKWLDTLSRNEKYPFSTKELRNELKHTFWLLNRVSSAKALKKLLESHPVYENYKIVLAAGNGKMNDESLDSQANLKSLEAVRRAIRENEKTITLSVGQLTTGVTIPEWTAVLMLSNIQSPALYMQAAFRSQNPYSWTENGQYFRKERAYIFDFAPERTLQLFDEFANNLSLATASGRGTSQTREENIKELLNFFPVIAEDNQGRMVEIDAKSVLTIPRQIKAQEVLKRGFMSNLLFDNIAGIFRATQTVLDILDDLPIEKQGKVNPAETDLELSDIELTDDGEILLPQDLVINKQMKLFGEKVYQLTETIPQIIDQVDYFDKKFVSDLTKQVSEVVLPEIQVEYQLKTSETKRIEKQIQSEFSSTFERSQIEFQIQQSHLSKDFEEKLKAEKDENLISELKKEYQVKTAQAQETFQKELSQRISDKIEELPEVIIQQQEIKKVEKIKATSEEEIRGHLRGFARTIPSFIMAYGDENLTLSNFDTYVPDSVFIDVTGISLEQFRFLRDGGLDFEGHLFDQPTFDEAIQEFLRKKVDLADYFKDHKEDIFDYIPTQKTNQIYTPKRVVRRIVDDLEKESPGIFDDSTKTFIDLYMKSGLYITEIVKRLFNSPVLQGEFPEEQDRLKHILEHQVYGFAPTEIIYRIATNFIFGELPETISRKHFLCVDTTPYAKEGKIQELVDEKFG